MSGRMAGTIWAIRRTGRPATRSCEQPPACLFVPTVRLCTASSLAEAKARPYMRRVVEAAKALARVPGARVKRTLLSVLGRRAARRAANRGLPGCDWLAGVTDPPCVADEMFWARWFGELRSGSVEICCHPGYRDESLIGRDCDAGTGLLRRERETSLLRSASFRESYNRTQLMPVRPSHFASSWTGDS